MGVLAVRADVLANTYSSVSSYSSSMSPPVCHEPTKGSSMVEFILSENVYGCGSSSWKENNNGRLSSWLAGLITLLPEKRMACGCDSPSLS